MKNDLLDHKVLYQQTQLGEIKLYLHPKELTILKLRYAPKQEIMKLWDKLWEGVGDYDELPAGCRTLMPSVVYRIQRMGVDEDWKGIQGLNLNFLAGLPPFVWTKNKFMLNQTLRIAEHVGKSGIEILAIKGMAELLSDTEMGNMRSTSDLDLLIRPDDFYIFTQKMSEIGYELVSNGGNLAKYSPLPKDQYLFEANSGYKLQVDVHVMVDKYHTDDRLTELVWLGKVPSKKCPTLFVPSPRDRFLISLVNGFRITNWYSGSYLKYLSDALSELISVHQDGNQGQLRFCVESLNCQDCYEQVLQIGREIGLFDEQIMETYALSHASDSNAVLKSPRSGAISFKQRIFSKLTKSLSLKNILLLLIYMNVISQVWQSRGKQVGLGKVIKFLLMDQFLVIITYVVRNVLKLSIWKNKDLDAIKKLSKTPVSSLKWN